MLVAGEAWPHPAEDTPAALRRAGAHRRGGARRDGGALRDVVLRAAGPLRSCTHDEHFAALARNVGVRQLRDVLRERRAWL